MTAELRLPREERIREPLQITNADGAMADLGQRVLAQYPGAATTPGAVRRIREEWHRPWWRRILRRGGDR